MTQFEKFNLMDIDTLAEWICEHGEFDGSPWCKWFDETYCRKCEPVMCHYPNSKREFPCAWCELERKCKFFMNLNEQPDSKDVIKMWLESEVKE